MSWYWTTTELQQLRSLLEDDNNIGRIAQLYRQWAAASGFKVRSPKAIYAATRAYMPELRRRSNLTAIAHDLGLRPDLLWRWSQRGLIDRSDVYGSLKVIARKRPQTFAGCNREALLQLLQDPDLVSRIPQNRRAAYSKPVVCVETGERFDTIGDAAKAIGVTVCAISKQMRGRTRTCRGYHWRVA